MNGFKKISIRIFVILYGASYFLQNSFFVNRRNVYAAENPDSTKLVAIFVDKEIYPTIKNKLERYSVDYIQQKIANSKAIILPIDTTTLQAHEISQILENMYFEGLKDQSSQLIGTILIGNIPLPVVENNGFVYPSIFPYVDFEDQQFIYDSNKRFFVYNDNPNGQAELRHGLIQFDNTTDYNTFFDKVKSYYNNPTTFIDKAIWYEDFIGLKKYFIPENSKYYVNSLIFAEDIGYHRFNNTLVDILTQQHNESSLAVGNDLSNSLQGTDDPELQAYAADIEARGETAADMQNENATLPTMTIKKTTEELLKGYDGLFSSQFLVKIKDNIASTARRFKTGSNNQTFTDFNSTTDKILQKDNRLLGDLDNNVQPLLIQINDYLENETNKIIEEEKYYMTVPLPVSKLNLKSEKKGLILPEELKKCIWTTYDYHENYLFGKKAEYLTDLQNASIYRGTFNTTSGVQETVTEPQQSIGGSYNIFSTQIEANRGYDFNSTLKEIDRYQKHKTNKESLRSTECRGITMFGYCIGRYVRRVNDSADEDKCEIDDITKQEGCESMTGFAARNRGGASPLNIDSETQTLTNYNYKNAVLPIYNIAGSKEIATEENSANSYKSIEAYTNMVRRIFSIGVQKKYTDNSLSNILTNAKDISNGNEVKFTAQFNNLSYESVNFFTKFSELQNHQRIGGKAVLHNLSGVNNTCEVEGTIYTYKTIDSRVKNIGPERDQISNSEFYKFKEGSDIYRFYTNVIEDLTKVKSHASTTTQTFSGTSTTDFTGVISNLTQIKSLIDSGNQGMQEIISFPNAQLATMTTTQINNKATERSNKNLNASKKTEIENRISKTKKGLEDLQNYIRGANISTTQSEFVSIIESEGFKDQTVEILDTQKATINQNLDAITAQVNLLYNKFIIAKNIYTTIGQIQNNIFLLQTKKSAIALLEAGEGCSIDNYKALCDVIDSVINTLRNISEINQKVDQIEYAQYTGGNDNIIVQPFVDITTLFSGSEIATEIIQTKTIMNMFDISTDPDKTEINKGMNLTTQDRPIDNIRNITFQGIGGDLVQFNYPNLYEVKVFSATGDKLTLKTVGEIQEAITTYLTQKAVEYNTLLQEQINRKNQYYQQYSGHFNFLGQIDPLANPNTHNYNLIPTNYFIQKTIASLDTLEDDFGSERIYGDIEANNDEQKLELLAKLLYYQNIARSERLSQATVDVALEETQGAFDINQKISNTSKTYLTQNNNQGQFITPTYNTTGYEVGYINSDGNDYIGEGTVPGFIKQIQDAQTQAETRKQNTYKEYEISPLQEEVNSCEGVDTNGSALLFDFETFKSPRLTAMICRWEKTKSKPFDIQVSFKNAQGPVFAGLLGDIQSMYSGRTQQREEYGDERTPADNESTIQNAPEEQQATLKDLDKNNTITVNKTSISVDNIQPIHLTMGMMKDIGLVKIKISATGDVCFKAQRGGSNFENICTKAASEVFNPNTEQYQFTLTPIGNTAGTSSLKIQFCLPTAEDSCIEKHQILHLLPGEMNTIEIIAATDKVMEGGQIPISIQGKDRFGNDVGQNSKSYKIYVGSGNGSISDGSTIGNSISFNNFNTKAFFYQAPSNIINDRIATIIVEEEQEKTTNTSQQVTNNPTRIAKNIDIIKGTITIEQNSIVLYKTDVTQTNTPKIQYTLPNNIESIIHTDEDNIVQILPESLPGIKIKVTDNNGDPLDTVMNITSEKGLLIPGVLQETTIQIDENTNKQKINFSKTNNLIITDGEQDITLYPNFKAGEDTITIDIPGNDPIIIPVIVAAGPANTVLLTLEKNKLNLTTTTGTTGTIQVVDAWNNTITENTNIKIGVMGAGTTSINEFVYTGQEYTYKINTKSIGGQGYIFAYIKNKELSQQMPGYQSFIVQEDMLPKEKLNIMYLNLFGTDRGNQRGYFSENNKEVNTITNKSEKLLATTTQLVDPNKIRKVEYIINPHGQIQNINGSPYTITIEDNDIIAQIPNIANLDLGVANTFKIQTIESFDEINAEEINKNMLFYLPEETDSIITENTASKTKISINKSTILDLEEAIIDPECEIVSTDERNANMNTYKIYVKETLVGTLAIWTIQIGNINIQDSVLYAKTDVFSEGSTNNAGIGIYTQSSTFIKQGYTSIEDSSAVMDGIGFTSKFKNVSNFANGQKVGEATIGYGSQFLINFGDPLLERKNENSEIPNTKFDASIGQTIYTDPDKTIFKTLPIDFNKDGEKDLVVVYTDGTIKLIKNYGGTQAYQNLQELMIIAERIKEIHIGDTDGDGFEDIIIITNQNKGLVYKNNEGIFSVDGKTLCLNTVSEPGQKNPEPENIGLITQLFIQDMNKDDIVDIVSNDIGGDIRIFYGGSTNDGDNYVSSTPGTCDADRYERQQNNYQIIKRFGIRVNNSRYIQDGSLVHRKDMIPPGESEEDTPIDDTEDVQELTEEEMEALKDTTLDEIMNLAGNTSEQITAGMTQFAYTENPLSTSPIYEILSPENIYYLPIDETNDTVSIYKEYEDMNGGKLKNNDEVVIKTTIIAKKATKITYIDQLKGPRKIVKNDDNSIASLVFLTNSGGINIDRNAPEGYQFVLDNIILSSGNSASFSYKVLYEAQDPTIQIAIKDEDLASAEKEKDTYPDIIINSTDSCQKNRRIFFNKNIGNKKTYEEIYDNIQEEINTYNEAAQTTQNEMINNLLEQLKDLENIENITNIPGMTDLESRNPRSLISSLLTEGGISENINISAIDDITANVSEVLDTTLQGLCQGFTLGEGGCQGIPVPFNQAFLAPGKYHIFGCVPTAPNPLAPLFATLNRTIGKGIPVLTFPGNRPNPVTPGEFLPFPGIFGLPFKGLKDTFYLGIKGGTKSSKFRLYIVPTLTLGVGIAMCFGSDSLGKSIPKPFSDMGGNCVVFAIPPMTNCGNATPTGGTNTQSLDASMVDAASVGVCNSPAKIGNTIVFAEDTTTTQQAINNGDTTLVQTANSPFEIVAAGSSENNPPYSAAIPQGNFAGLIQIDQSPLGISADEDYGNAQEQITNTQSYELKDGTATDNKILGGKSQGLVQCVVQDWMTRQIQYIQNNLTKMTIQIDLPDMTTLFQGFDKIGNLQETYKALQEQDKAEGYITTGEAIDFNQGTGGGEIERTKYLSAQQAKNISKSIGENPFQAIQEIFKEVPLIQIESQDINIQIPSLTSDEINTYINYLTLRGDQNEKILEDWTNTLNQMFAMCGTTSKSEARAEIENLEKIKIMLSESDMLSDNNEKRIIKEQNDMNKILELNEDTLRKEMGADIKNIGINISNTTSKIAQLPERKLLQIQLEKKKAKEGKAFKEQKSLDSVNTRVEQLTKCSGIAGEAGNLLTFRENSAGLIRSVKQNIIVLEKYKEFPTQLYERTHLTDRYITEIGALASDFVGGLTYRVDSNANRYEQYVDSIILIAGTIKTRQALIDFSVNRSEKCSTCSNDNYGSYSCSLSFLCPKLPIFPIPPFKIPNIYMDMSHVELGMNIVLPKINFIPKKTSLPQIPNIPEPPSSEVNRDIVQGLDVNFFKEVTLPTIPVIPEPPILPEPPSFIPSIKMDLPVLPPAPKIPKIAPEISAILNVGEFIGKVFCIVKGGIGLVGENGVKAKVEQLTQRTREVPVFDFIDLTTKFQDPPLQGFDYKLDAYTTLKFNFDGVYDVFNSIAEKTNDIISEVTEKTVKKAIDRSKDQLDNAGISTGYERLIDTGFDVINDLNQTIDLNGYIPNEEPEMIAYASAYTQLKQGVLELKNKSTSDKEMTDTANNILGLVEHQSTVLPATEQIQNVGDTAQKIINTASEENKHIQEKIQNYDEFIKDIQKEEIQLVAHEEEKTQLSTSILTIDTTTKNILNMQEDPTKSYFELNKNLVEGYLGAVQNNKAEELNMSEATYNKSKTYLESTKKTIDTALLAYENPQNIFIAQAPCTDCENATEQNQYSYSTDLSAYVEGIFVETYSGEDKKMTNTVSSKEHITNVQKQYITDQDLNNDTNNDILMYDNNSIYIKYADQESEHFSQQNNALTHNYNKFYSYANEHTRNRYIESLEQLADNANIYGYIDIKDISIKVIQPNKEVKNFKTIGQTFDNLQIGWKNSKNMGESVDGYLIQINKKIDKKDDHRSFRDLFTTNTQPRYILVLPDNTEYNKALLTIDNNMIKRPVAAELGENILEVKYYNPAQDDLQVSIQDMPRERLYINVASLTIHQEELSNSQQKSFVFYKKTSPRSNQTVVGIQNLGDVSAPIGEVKLRRNATNQEISEGLIHEGFINTKYTLKSTRTDQVIVKRMEIRKDGEMYTGKNNDSQTGTIDIGDIFFTGTTQQQYEFIATDQNNNIAKETVTLNISIPEIEVTNVKKSGAKTAEIIAKISNDIDEGMVIFQKLRNGLRKNIEGTAQNQTGGFSLSPNQTIITGGIFTIGNDIGLYDNQGNEIAIINPESGEITITQGYEDSIYIDINMTTHIPVIEVKNSVTKIMLFQVVLPIATVDTMDIVANNGIYTKAHLVGQQFGEFNDGYCIKNDKNECIVYTNSAGAIYIPGIYASALKGRYSFDTDIQKPMFIIQDESEQDIVNISFTVKVPEN